MTTCARITTTSAEVVVFCFSGGYDRIRKKVKKETVGVEGGFLKYDRRERRSYAEI